MSPHPTKPQRRVPFERLLDGETRLCGDVGRILRIETDNCRSGKPRNDGIDGGRIHHILVVHSHENVLRVSHEIVSLSIWRLGGGVIVLSVVLDIRKTGETILPGTA